MYDDQIENHEQRIRVLEEKLAALLDGDSSSSSSSRGKRKLSEKKVVVRPQTWAVYIIGKDSAEPEEKGLALRNLGFLMRGFDDGEWEETQVYEEAQIIFYILFIRNIEEPLDVSVVQGLATREQIPIAIIYSLPEHAQRVWPNWLVPVRASIYYVWGENNQKALQNFREGVSIRLDIDARPVETPYICSVCQQGMTKMRVCGYGCGKIYCGQFCAKKDWQEGHEFEH